MTVNDSPTEESELTPKQEQFIAALVAGNAIVVAARAVGIGEKTAHRWLKQPVFKQAYQEAKQAVYDDALEGLRDSLSDAISTLKRNMTSDTVDPAVQVRAAHIYLTQSIQVHKIEEMEAQIRELQEAVKARLV